MLDDEQMRFAIEDARTRHAAVVGLIASTDQQALALLSLYVTLGLATASGAIGGLMNPSAIPHSLVLPLIAATLEFGTGAYFCLRTIETSVINLPGREAEFWIWAARDDVTTDSAFLEYLTNLQTKSDLNADLNKRTSQTIKWARRAGISAPLAALATWLLQVIFFHQLS